MTVIKSISAKGFKSFAKKTELLFGNNYNCIIGPNGSGKSLSYDSIVTLSNGDEIKIGDLVENSLRSSDNVKTLDDGVYCEVNDVSILSVNPITMKIEEKKIAKIVKREGEILYNIKTRSGREVKATGCHPVMLFRGDSLKSVLVSELKEYDLISTPRKIAINSSKNFDSEKARLLGYLLGDGNIKKQTVRFTNQDEDVIQDINNIVNKHFGVLSKKNVYKKNEKIVDLIWYDKSLLKWIWSLFPDIQLNASTKIIPDEILKANLDVISNVLAGLFDTDGGVRKDVATIEYCSKNKNLTYQIQRLLLRFGVLSKVKMRLNCASNTVDKTRRPYYYLYIWGYENIKNFYINIPLKCSHKKTALENILKNKVKSNPNVDLLPKETNKLIRKAVQLLGIKVKNLRKAYPKLVAYVENRCNPTRDGLEEILPLLEDRFLEIYSEGLELKKDQFTLVGAMDMLHLSGISTGKAIGLKNASAVRRDWATGIFKPRAKNLDAFFSFIEQAINSRVQELESVMNSLSYLVNSDIFWDEVVEIKEVEAEPYVYDLTVPDNHNFVANGIFVHNSNIADLITFVLGKSSAKSMRAEKTANLIYNGGKDSKPFKEAEATVVFDNSDELFPLKEKEVAITRIVKQTGNSIYKINNIKMTKQQVVDFLGAANIDPDGHNIILQGDIVHFMEMRSEERRQIIEDIAGISVYQEKKERAMRELEKFQLKIGEIEIILTERNTYLKELKSERDQAVRYRELEENVKRSKATVLDLQLKKKRADLKNIENNIQQHEEQKLKFDEKIQSLKTEIDAVKQEIKRINEEIELKGEKEQKQLHKEIELLRECLSRDKNRLETLQNELSRIDIRKKQLKSDREELGKKINDIRENIKKLSSEKNNYDKEEGTIASRIKESKGKVVDDLDSHINRKQEMLYSFKDKEQVFLREKDKIFYLLEDISKKLSVSSQSNVGDISKIKKEFKEVADELNKKLNNDSMYASQLGKARREIVEKNEKLATLKFRDIGIRERNAADLSIRQILKAGINGVFNTVGDLGEVDKKYSLALEVAAGPRINAVVVQDDLVASKCIKYLKEKKMGIVAFLPLNKMRPVQISSAKKGKGIYGSALDLVKFEPKFNNVFSYVFGNTLVVENVEIARDIGIGSARMVTLDGDLMETSGAMIGGYRKRKEGLGFKEKDVNDEIMKLEGEVSHLQNTINTLEQNKSENEALLFNLREQKANFEIEIMKIEKTTGVVDFDKLNKDKKELNAQLTKLNKEIEDVQQDISSLGREIQLLRDKKQKEAGELGLNSLESQRSSLREKIVSLESDIKNMNNQLDTMLTPEYEKIAKILKDHDKEIEEFTQEMKTLQISIKEANHNLKEKEVIEQKFYSEFKNLFNKKNKIQEQLQQKESNLVREEERVIALNNRFNVFSIDRARITAEIAGLEKEFEPFIEVSIRKGVSIDELRSEIHLGEKDLIKFGNVNLKALEVYESLEKEYQSLVEKSDKLKQEKEDVVAMMHEIESKKKGLFMKTFSEIEKNFREIFNQLTTKGHAYLELEDVEDPFNGGLDIKVKITGNKYLDIKGLSGGEKTMAALAFIFAIQECQPASFYLFDEVDAALDKTNSTKLSKLFAQYSQRAQYVVISHNDTIISEANQIYGVSMNNGVSKVVSLKV